MLFIKKKVCNLFGNTVVKVITKKEGYERTNKTNSN